jgi:hypothetical protein
MWSLRRFDETACLFVCEQAMKEIERQTGKPFEQVFTERLAEHLRQNPAELPRLRRMLAEREQPPRKKRDRHEYFSEAWAKRDAAEDRWLAIQKEIDKVQFPKRRSWGQKRRQPACAELPNFPGLRVEELIAYAELYAGAEHLGHAENALEAHLREQRIDALASFIADLCDPMAGTTEPLEAA